MKIFQTNCTCIYIYKVYIYKPEKINVDDYNKRSFLARGKIYETEIFLIGINDV